MVTTAARKKSAAAARAREAIAAENEAFTSSPEGALRPAAAAARALSRAARLKEVRLPRGDVGSINVGFYRSDPASIQLDPAQALREGYEGLRIIGAGRDLTHVRPPALDDIGLSVIRHNGIVQVEGVTIHEGLDKGLHVGQGNEGHELAPGFLFRLYDSAVVADPPDPGERRPKWGGFFYGADLHLRDVRFEGFEQREHDGYVHQVARHGQLLERLDFSSAGAECWKTRSDPSECAWPGAGAWIIGRGLAFKDWYQVHSDRGGGGFVGQGTGSNILLEDSIFWGGRDLPNVPAHLRSRCFMVTGEGYFDALAGPACAHPFGVEHCQATIGGTGPGNGFVILRRCAMGAGGPAPSWWSDILRVGREGGAQSPARGLLIDGCGIFGERYSVDIGDVPRYVVRGCNTPEIRRRCQALGIDATHEACVLTAVRPIPLSEGLVRAG